jgi:integrase
MARQRKRRGRVKLTKDPIERLQPELERYAVAVTGYPGLEVRVTPNGVKTFTYSYKTHDGKRARYTIGRFGKVTPKAVRSIIMKLGGEVADRRDPQAEKREACQWQTMPTFSKFVSGAYADYARGSDEHRSADQTIDRLLAAFLEFADKQLNEVTAWDIDLWRSGRAKSGVKPTTIRRDLGALRAMFSKAVDWKLLDQSPAGKVKLPKIDRDKRPRSLEDDEEQRLREALKTREVRMKDKRTRFNGWRETRGLNVYEARTVPYSDHLAPIILLALNSGLRRGEIFNLEWRDFDPRRKRLTVRAEAAKDSETRVVPLNEEALIVLKDWKKQQPQATGLIFPNKDGERLTTIKTALRKLLNDARISGAGLHSFRHTFGTKLANSGTPLPTVRDLMGHSDITMTARYLHSEDKKKAEAVASLEQIS